jgi:formylglycine-generating enzyme required for sulfatase activity
MIHQHRTDTRNLNRETGKIFAMLNHFRVLISSVLCTFVYIGLSAQSKGFTDKVTVEASKAFTSKMGIEMVSIPAGEFMMGCSEGDSECEPIEKPTDKVKITKSFHMGKYEVTQGQWKAVIGNNPSDFSSCGHNCPVEKVSWNDIKEFLLKLNTIERRKGARMFRLPTEAEWEYAARGGTKTKYYANDLDSIAWHSENSGIKMHPVGQKAPNAFGLYDMLGNVLEWTEDWYGANTYSASERTDPIGLISGENRVLRGGFWMLNAAYNRSSYRNGIYPHHRSRYMGFRIAVVLP